MFSSFFATCFSDTSYAPLPTTDSQTMDKHGDHIELSAVSPERGIELENLSTEGSDDKNILRLGKKPVLRVRSVVLQC